MTVLDIDYMSHLPVLQNKTLYTKQRENAKHEKTFHMAQLTLIPKRWRLLRRNQSQGIDQLPYMVITT